MTLYVYSKKDKGYKPLSAKAIKKMKQADEVAALKAAANSAVPTIRALSAWLKQVDARGKKVSTLDMVVARLPNRQRLESLAASLEDAAESLR